MTAEKAGLMSEFSVDLLAVGQLGFGLLLVHCKLYYTVLYRVLNVHTAVQGLYLYVLYGIQSGKEYILLSMNVFLIQVPYIRVFSFEITFLNREFLWVTLASCYLCYTR